ncbi:MAG: regulator [Rhodocyclaceae bacterium]|nr:regulator [Rhodocyclaceae bacterium]
MSETHPLAAFEHDYAWHRLGDFPHFHYNVLAVDPEREIADFLIRYEPNGRIFLHRHRSDTHTLVLRGEHRLYEPDGSLKEVRPVGCYTAAPADAPPHSEGGGAEGALVLYSTRGGAEGVLFDVLDEAGQVVATLDLADVAGLFEAQGRQPGG